MSDRRRLRRWRLQHRDRDDERLPRPEPAAAGEQQPAGVLRAWQRAADGGLPLRGSGRRRRGDCRHQDDGGGGRSGDRRTDRCRGAAADQGPQPGAALAAAGADLRAAAAEGGADHRALGRPLLLTLGDGKAVHHRPRRYLCNDGRADLRAAGHRQDGRKGSRGGGGSSGRGAGGIQRRGRGDEGAGRCS